MYVESNVLVSTEHYPALENYSLLWLAGKKNPSDRYSSFALDFKKADPICFPCPNK
ncbi:hypothetical protein MAMP_00649 [Methylophaga aminisulfidivorans MP]|uniref:Uncharacterized protein n=1 Tax=Methylophaga aminisulfidivorans MP TaxID=1026882 RepID=F5T1U5_9GAMM|nr:hypothetical protein MAMP_00649 [Methylophaga aminisulfidivorans MP]